MVVVVGIVAVLLVVLVWAVYAEDVPASADPDPLPEWHDFPTPADVRRAGFPLAVLGYDPAVVQRHLDRVAEAFETALTAREVTDAPALDRGEQDASGDG